MGSDIAYIVITVEKYKLIFFFRRIYEHWQRELMQQKAICSPCDLDLLHLAVGEFGLQEFFKSHV